MNEICYCGDDSRQAPTRKCEIGTVCEYKADDSKCYTVKPC